ncbi:MAG: MATE family efflux transporter [Rubricoccaceae bacterium]|nr:MATE family efflux transporter [Rubricoccaceae bacterium]
MPSVSLARREVRATLVLAVPLVLTQLSQMAMSFVDVIMIGRLGTTALAAGVLGSSLFVTLSLMSMGVVLAVNPSVAQSYGAGDALEVGRWARQGLWLGLFLGLPLVALFGQGEAILRAVGQEPEVAALAGDYLRAIRWGVVPNLWFTALRGLCEGVGQPRPVLVVTVVAIAVNAAANWVLMYGKLGFPALGLEGTGWSSAIVMAVMFVLLGGYVRRAPALGRYRVFVGLRRPDGPHLRALFRLGWPIGVNFGLEAGLFLAATFLVGLFGTVALAAHQVAINAASVTFMVPLGIGMAGTVRVGQAVGRGDGPGAARAGWAAIGLGGAFMLLAALLFWLRPEWVVWLYTGQGGGEGVAPEVVSLAALLLGVAAVFQLFDGVQATAAGALRGLKDTRVPMLIGGFSYWVVGMSAAVGLGFGLDLGAPGVWGGLTLGLATAAALLTLRFRRRVRARAPAATARP